MNANLLPFVAAGIAVSAVLVVAFAVIEYQRTVSKRRSLALVMRIGGVKPADEHMVETERESFVGELVTDVADRVVSPGGREKLRQHLAWAGKSNVEDLRAALDRKIIYGIAGLCLGILGGLRFGGWGWVAVPALTVFGFLLPNILVYNEGLKRTQEILYSLPDALDLLNLCVESGLSLQAALARVADTQSGPVAAEFGRVLQEMRLGVSRSDAFEGLANRTNQEDLKRFVVAILQVDKLGIPVAAVLREQAREMRSKRQSRAREQAQKVPVKILAPLMLCFLPGLFIIILGPAVINAYHTFVG